MKCFIGQEDFQIQEPTVVTIGKFDGRHRGHQKLLGAMLKWKQEWGYKTAVFTFDMAPAARSEEHTSELQTRPEIAFDVLCL